jgi:hypothetical protein
LKKRNPKKKPYKIIAFITLGLLAVPILLNLLVFSWEIDTNIPILRFFNTRGDVEGWLSFWGNLVGTIVSGFVAYVVAKTTLSEQSKSDKRLETDLLIISQLPALIRIRIEIDKILGELLRIIKEKAETIEEYKEQGISVKYDELIYSLDFYLLPLNEENFKSIGKILHVDLQADLIELQEFYNSFRSSLEFSIIYSENDVAEFRETEAENMLHKAMNTSQERKSNRSREEIFELMGQIRKNKELRIKGWKKIEEDNFISILSSMLIEVVNRIELIREKTSDREFYY